MTDTAGPVKNRQSNPLIARSIITSIKNVNSMNESTASEYALRSSNFMNFVANEYPDILDMDNLLIMLKQDNLDPYNLLNGYAAYLRNRNVSALTIKQRLVTIKNFFEYCDIDISPRRFKLKVKLPKVIRKKEALSKEDIIEILNVCDNIRVRTYVILPAATGMRAVEALSTVSLIWTSMLTIPSFL